MSSTEVSVVAIVKAKAGQGKVLHAAIVEMLIPPTRAEEGCILYNLHTDNNDENTLIFYEKWESAEHLKKHLASAHFEAFGAKSKDLIDSLTIHELTQDLN